MLPHFKHQLETIEKFKTIPRGLDLSDPGTGKTRSQIDLFSSRRSKGAKCALIIAPKSLLESAWLDDITKFAPGLRCSIAYANNRERAFEATADIYITNTDATRWLAKQPSKFFRRFDTLIVDEISSFKHRTSLRSKSLKKIVKYFQYRYGLTGTPNANGLQDVWHQALVIDDGERLGTRFMQFRQTTQNPIQVGPESHMLKWVDKPGAAVAVADRLSDISVRYRLEDCHDLPRNHVYSMNYDMPPKQRAAYETMAKHAILEVSRDEVVNAVNAAVLITKLLQISSGTVYDESGSSINIKDDRYQLVCDLVAARSHSLVFFNWRHQADHLEALFKKAGIPTCRFDGTVKDRDRVQVVRDFQKGYYQVCLAQPQSAAHGLTLTKATTAIWTSPTYNLEHFLQGNRRIYRAGQTRKTETILITAKGTIEEKVYAKLQEKDLQQLEFLKILKTLSV
jgi:SNF2 family DNA or RNA helicase